MYEYAATLVRVHDGDTVFLDVDLGFHAWLHATRSPNATEDQASRLARINAPELKVHDASGAYVDNPAGIAARDALASFLEGKAITIRSLKGDKYGRWLIELYANGENANDWMLANGYAVGYNP